MCGINNRGIGKGTVIGRRNNGGGERDGGTSSGGQGGRARTVDSARAIGSKIRGRVSPERGEVAWETFNRLVSVHCRMRRDCRPQQQTPRCGRIPRRTTLCHPRKRGIEMLARYRDDVVVSWLKWMKGVRLPQECARRSPKSVSRNREWQIEASDPNWKVAKRRRQRKHARDFMTVTWRTPQTTKDLY